MVNTKSPCGAFCVCNHMREFPFFCPVPTIFCAVMRGERTVLLLVERSVVLALSPFIPKDDPTTSPDIARRHTKRCDFEIFHDQLPLAVPCYDLAPVTELTVGPANAETSGISGSLGLTGECDFWNISRSLLRHLKTNVRTRLRVKRSIGT